MRGRRSSSGMSEKSYLLAKPTNSGDYEEMNKLQRIKKLNQNARDVIEKQWAKVVRRIHAREVFAEFLGTFVLIVFGVGSIAQSVLSNGANGGFLSINIGWFVGLVIGCYVAIGVSGAHFNPAVTFAMALRGRTCWIKVIPYWIAQFLGAFFASAVVYGVYVDAVKKYDGDPHYCGVIGTNTSNIYSPLCTGKIWATYPQQYLSLANGFLDQVIGTYLLLLGIFAVCDSQNSEPKAGLKPLMIGVVLLGVGIAYGFNAGYGVNPARDFGPRFFTYIAGWGKDVFVCSQCSIRQWWWVPVVAPMVGAPLAALTYWFLIDAHHPPKEETQGSSHTVSIPGYQDLNKHTSYNP